MMQSVALNESSYYGDDDYVVVDSPPSAKPAVYLRAAFDDPMAGILDCGDDADESYDYCDDAHQETAVHALLTGRTFSFVGDDADAETLLDLASSMVYEIGGRDDSAGGDIPSARISSTKLDFEPSCPESHTLAQADSSVANQQNPGCGVVVAEEEPITSTSLDEAVTVPAQEPSSHATLCASPTSKTSNAIGEDSDEATTKGREQQPHQEFANKISRLNNKKRRKQLKLAKKLASAAAAAANLAQRPSTPKTQMRRTSAIRRPSGKVAPNGPVSCATQSLESYRPKMDLEKQPRNAMTS